MLRKFIIESGDKYSDYASILHLYIVCQHRFLTNFRSVFFFLLKKYFHRFFVSLHRIWMSIAMNCGWWNEIRKSICLVLVSSSRVELDRLWILNPVLRQIIEVCILKIISKAKRVCVCFYAHKVFLTQREKKTNS